MMRTLIALTLLLIGCSPPSLAYLTDQGNTKVIRDSHYPWEGMRDEHNVWLGHKIVSLEIWDRNPIYRKLGQKSPNNDLLRQVPWFPRRVPTFDPDWPPIEYGPIRFVFESPDISLSTAELFEKRWGI
jgi:hypothetical protein